jgi:Polysaccharide lyase
VRHCFRQMDTKRTLRAGLVAALLLVGLGPAGSVADETTRTVSLADDFRGAVGSIWRLQRIRKDAITVVRDPAGQDRDVVAITLRSGDMADSTGTSERAELSEADQLHLPTGTDVWYSFALYLPVDFPVVDRRLVLGQWKQGCGNCTADHSPGIANRYRNGVFSITIQDGDRRVVLFEEKADIRGRWNHLVYHLKLVPRPEGFLQAWLNGRQVVDYQGPIGYPDDLDHVYFKIGLYRDNLADPMTMLLARFRRGSTRAEVDGPTP